MTAFSSIVAIDEFDNEGRISRGCVIIDRQVKKEVLEALKFMNIHSTSLQYPGLDIVA